jgi:hypothetical protein
MVLPLTGRAVICLCWLPYATEAEVNKELLLAGMTDSQGKNGFADTNGGKELCLGDSMRCLLALSCLSFQPPKVRPAEEGDP